jgi:predicted permease
MAIVTSLFFGLLPAISAGRLDLAHSLKEGRAAGWKRQYGTTLLISGEIALAFVLLVGTGLLTRTFINVLRIDPGFHAQNVYTFRLSGAGHQMLRQLQQNLGAMPGVQSVSAVSHLPLDDAGNWYDYYWKEDTPAELQNTAMADLRSVLPGYFGAIGATLIRGRDFLFSDDPSHQHVAVIDDVVAQALWPGEDAIGKKLSVSDSPDGPYEFQRDWVLVVGIVHHVQYHSLTSIVRPQIYLPFPLAPRPNMAMVVRTTGPVPDLASVVRKQVGQLNRNVALSRLEPLSLLVQRALAETGFASLLATLLAVIAVLLASIGIYGMLSYSIARRTSEIGIRMAIGANRRHVSRVVLGDVLASVCLGVTAGFLLSLAAAPLLSHLLFGVKPYNPTNYAIILVAILLVSAVAVVVPVRRATRIDPVVALRHE